MGSASVFEAPAVVAGLDDVAVDRGRCQDLDHLAIAIITALQLATKALQCRRQGQLLERRPFLRAPGFFASTGT